MRKKDNSTEYMYISARVRAIEASMPGREMIGRMIGAQDASSAAAVAVESGILSSAEDARDPDRLDCVLSKRLRDALETVESDEGGRQVTPIIRLSYDCANLKAALRCIPNGIDFSDLLFDVGTFPAEKYGEMVTDGDFSPLSKNLREAAEKAKTEYATTCDPLKIDLPIDRACFADMLCVAEEIGDSFVLDYLKTRIDMTNVMMVSRIVGMGDNGMTRALMDDVLIDGGYIGSEEWCSISETGGTAAKEQSDRIGELVAHRYPQISEALENGGGNFENACDSLIESKLQEARYIPFGIPIVLAFLSELEYEIKNVRIILAGKAAGLTPEEIAQRVRGSYV